MIQNNVPPTPNPHQSLSARRAEHGDTALIWAVRQRRPDLVANTVEKYQFPVDDQNYDGETPLFVATMMDWVEATGYLLEKGANPNIARSAGEYPLHVAVANANNDLVELLVREGAWLDVEDGNGETPLHYAVREENIGALEHLLLSGANPHHLSEDNESPLDLAKAVASEDILRCFTLVCSPYAVEGEMGALSNSLNTSLRLSTSSEDSSMAEDDDWAHSSSLGSSLGQSGSLPCYGLSKPGKSFLPFQSLYQLNTGTRILV